MPVHAVSPLTPYLSMVAVAFLYYRRMRRTFGRQQWNPTRAVLRLSILALLFVMLTLAASVVPHIAVGMLVGAVLGAGLGLLSLRHTHTEWIEGRGWYTPNPWIGGALSVALLARLIWRWSQGAFAMGANAAGQNASPLTFGIAMALITYSLVHVGGLWLRMRQLRALA